MNLIKPRKITFFAVLIFLATAAFTAFALNYPLLGTLGSESGILFGAIVGPLMFFGGAIRGAYRDERGFSQDLSHEFSVALVALGIFIGALLVNAFFVSSCAPARGLLPFAIHAVPVVIFYSLCGLFIGRLIGRRLISFIAAVLVAAAYVAIRCVMWWQNPSFRILSHPFVIVDSDLWGGAGLSSEVIGFRSATLLFSLALIFLGLALFSNSHRTSFVREKALRFGTMLPVGVFLLLGGISHFIVTDKLEPSTSERELELSSVLRRGQFVVHSNPQKTSMVQASAILAEANLWGSRLKSRMGEAHASDVHIWLYPDEDTLTRFTGASNIHFALPRHRQVHITNPVVPHPTLGHEIAHVFIGEKTSTLLGLPGVFSLFPNQGLSEGLAVMLTPELSIKNDLTVMEQAAAIAKADKLPDFNRLFGISPLSFFAHNSSMSYSVAGAYLQELTAQKAKEQKAIEALIARLASEGEVDGVFESKAARLQFDHEFTQRLKSLEIPKDAVASVNALFARVPILSLTCPESTQKEAFVTDPIVLAQRILAEADRLNDESAQKKQVLLERAADLFWEGNDHKTAVELWSQLQFDLLPLSEQRLPQAKLILSQAYNTQLARRSLDYLVSASTQRTAGETAAAMNLAAELQGRNLDFGDSSAPVSDLVAAYLVTRPQLLARANAQEISALERLSANATLPQSFQLESLRLMAHANALSSKPQLAVDQFKQLATLNTRTSIRLQMLDYTERSERISAAMQLEPNDSIRSDIWLLGTHRFEP